MTDSTMTKISNLPRDLVEEVLSRVPLTSLREMRLTCKNWNGLSNDRSFTQKQIGKAKAATTKKKESLMIMKMDFKVYLMSINLSGIRKEDYNVESTIKRKGKLISLSDANRVDISIVYNCDGLVLCITNDISSRLVVWNPCFGQTRWIKPRNAYHKWDRYALGYEKKNSNRSHKILRFVDDYDGSVNRRVCEFEIYKFKSNSWKTVADVTPDWYIEFNQRGVSLKGNTYWFAQKKFQIVHGEVRVEVEVGEILDLLICFDFTAERFGPRLPLPFNPHGFKTVSLSSVGENQLAVLCQRMDTFMMKIWISNKIEPNAVSWRKLFLAVDMKPRIGVLYPVYGWSFFVDNKNKVAVVLGKQKDVFDLAQNVAYIIGKKGYFKQVDLGETNTFCCPLVCSFVPISLRVKQVAREIKVDKTAEEATQELENRGKEANQN